MDNTINLIRYWRNSLADAMRMDIDPKRLNEAFKVSTEIIKNGKIDAEIAKSLYKKAGQEEPENIDSEDSDSKKSISILICPVVAMAKLEHGAANDTYDNTITPLWLPAVLTYSGYIKVKPDVFPWIPRTLLEPSSGRSITVGSVDDLDEFLTLNKIPNAEAGWSTFFDFGIRMFESVVKQAFNDFTMENYEIASDSLILVDTTVQGASKGIINLYDNILRDAEISDLLKTYANRTCTDIIPLLNNDQELEASKSHLGQMGFKFPLSKSQRQSINHFITTSHGEILAINGPPGTGKTTLLQSVVASLWVGAAVKEEEPPVIVAASANNQAVTNIIDSFGNVDEPDNSLAGRWLTEIKSYGLYCPSNSKLKTENVYQVAESYHKGPFPSMVEDQAYVKRNTEFFIKKCGEYAGKEINSLTDCLKLLHNELLKTTHGINKGLELFAQYSTHKKCVEEKYQQFQGLEGYIKQYEEKVQLLDELLKKLDEIELGWLNHFSTEHWFLSLLSFLPPIREKIMIRNRQYCLSTQYHLDTDFSNKTLILNAIQKIRDKHIAEKKNNLHMLENGIKDKELLDSLIIKLTLWAEKFEIQWNKIPCSFYDISDYIDMKIRYKAFKIATHYWECRWLIQMEEQFKTNYNESRSMDNQQIKWRRYAKLTPCFVSTFFMIPKFFTAYRTNEMPLYNFIDLLIIDEAGQVPPEVAGAAFGLARKALVVGDMLQIEPVWSINSKVDISNMKKFEIIKSEVDKEIEVFYKTGMSSSTGCVMKIAQNASKYQRFTEERGMFLTEHRRCYNEIIEYCNELAYKGRLEPKRGRSNNTGKIPCMGYINIKGKAVQSGGSWGNTIEAKEIVKWILENKEYLEGYYSEKDEKIKVIGDIIGVVTPFSYQGRLIKSELRKSKLKDITVGTVHTLQGAERNVIIFSSVYDSGQNGRSYFFDKGVNMLNVAVSRAKDAFIVCGDKDIFDSCRNTPSGILAKYIS